jgi:hypothetical protein
MAFVIINYLLRGVWSYNLVKLDRYSGWKLIATTILIMYSFSLLFYIIKYNTINLIEFEFKKSRYFLSGLINIIFFLMMNK